MNVLLSSIKKVAVSGALAISCITPVAANSVSTASAATVILNY